MLQETSAKKIINAVVTCHGILAVNVVCYLLFVQIIVKPGVGRHHNNTTKCILLKK